MRQVAVALRVVDAVADHELVGDLEADPLGLDVDLAPRRLVEQRADLEPRRAGGCRGSRARASACGRCRRCPRPPARRAPRSRRAGPSGSAPRGSTRVAVAVGGDLEEVDLDRQVELAHEVGDEDERAAQQPDDHELVGAGVEGRDLARPAPRPARRSPWPRSARRSRMAACHATAASRPPRPLCRAGILWALSAPDNRPSPGAPMPTHAEKRHVPYSAERCTR